MRNYTNFIPAQSAATSFTSGPINIGDAGNVFVGYTLSGSNVAGTLLLECSTERDFTNYWTVSNSSTSITNSADGYLNVTDINCQFIRVKWTYTSGTGNITIDVSIREPYIAHGG